MPRKKMISGKKAFVIEALMRLIIAIVLLFAVLKIGKLAAESVFGGKDAMQSFENLVSRINLLEDGEAKQEILTLDKDTGIIGFSKNAQEFRCQVCQKRLSRKLLSYQEGFYYSMQKPSNEQCNNKPCICLCIKGLKATPVSEDKSVISCQEFSCRTLAHDILARISLEEALKKKNIQLSAYPFWENGFFFVRANDEETPLDGTASDSSRKRTLYIENNKINQETYVAACPELPCVPPQIEFGPQ